MIRVDISRCTGCRRCEVACSFFRTGKVNRAQARIKVSNLYETGIDGPVVCGLCRERYCTACPEGAISVGPLGQVIVSPTVCTLCGACEKACPVGAVEIFDSIVYVCDLCGGRPQCVEACTEGALVYTAQKKDGPSLAGIKKQAGSRNPDQKRRFFIEKLGAAVRKKWRRV